MIQPMIQRITQQNLTFRQGLMQGSFLSIVMLIIWSGGLFNGARLGLNNSYYLTKPTTENIIIVALDDASLQTYGRSPVEWDRSLYVDVIRATNEGGARVVAFDILFSEATPNDEQIAETLLAARRGEFNAEGFRTRFVMPASGIQPRNTDTRYRLNFLGHLPTVPTLADPADYVAYVNTYPDSDTAVRIQPSIIEVNGEFGLSLSIATLLAYSGIPAAAAPQLVIAEDNQLAITPDITPDRVIDIDENGFWRINYFGTSPESFAVVSFKDVVEGTIDPTIFEDKIVLVGLMDATGLVDQYEVPLGVNGRLMPGVEILANAIESLQQNLTISRPNTITYGALLVFLTMLCSVIYAALRWQVMLATMVGVLIVFIGGCFLLFDTIQLEIDLLYGTLAIALPASSSLLLNITREANRRRQAEFLLESLIGVAETELNTEKILPLVQTDIQAILNAPHGSIWLYQAEQFTCAHEWGTPTITFDDPRFSQAQTQAITQGLAIGLPLRWQQRLIGLLFIELKSPPTRRQLTLIHTLADQLAPILHNAQLLTQIQQQNTLLSAILEGTPNGVLTFDMDLTLLQANAGANRQFQNFNIHDLIGESLQEILDRSKIDDATSQAIQKRFQAGKAFREEIRISKNAYYAYAVPLEENKLWLVIFNDVSPLAELNNLKTHMIRMASHDLKNPLNSIMGFTEMLSDDPSMDDRHKRYLGFVTRAANNMLNIIEDILNLEQLQSGRTEREPLNLGSLIQSLLETHNPDALSRNHVLNANIPKTPLYIEGDYRLLSQALSNLVGNAIKYTPDGGEITLRIIDNNALVRVEVQDNGFGIAKEAQSRLFTQFYRVRTAENSHIKGTGLGLSLVKSIVEDHQGKVWVESETGKGSTFFVELPLMESDPTITTGDTT